MRGYHRAGVAHHDSSDSVHARYAAQFTLGGHGFMEVAKITLTLGDAQRAFAYRKGTVDEAAVVQALQAGADDPGRLRRWPELAALYERMAASGKPPLIVDTAADIGASAVFFAHKFPKARVVALEPEPADFQLLTANTAGLPVECLQAAVASLAGSEAAAPAVTLNELYGKTPDAEPFIVKLDLEAGDLFAANTEWVARTPLIIAALGDHLVPGTARSRAFVERAADWNRDFFYLHDNIFSISREPGLLQAAA